MEDALRLHYAKLANMGDLLNKLIIEHCFGISVERRSFLSGDMCAIGSCLGQYTYHGSLPMKLHQAINGHLVKPHVYVWGTGFINHSDSESRFFKKDIEFLAVRGEMTRENAERMTGRRLAIPTGDAGILADRLLDEVPKKKYDIGIVPHLCDQQDPAAAALAGRYENSVLINVKDDPIFVIKQIARCRTLLSSSLHGLIVADSFNIPNMHVVFSDRPKGDGFKYEDYYSSYNLPHISRDLRSAFAPSIAEIEGSYSISCEMANEKKKTMLSCFPREYIKKGDNQNGPTEANFCSNSQL